MTTKKRKSASKGFDILGKITRRTFLAGSAGAGVAASWPLIIVPGKAKASQHELLIAIDGGRIGDARVDTIIKPFEKETGIKAVAVFPTRTISKFKSMVLTKNYDYDVSIRGGSQALVAENEGLLERIPGHIGMSGMLDSEWEKYESAVADIFYTDGIAYDTKRNSKAHKDWKEFWDTHKFPGRRALWAIGEEVLEAALMADGADAKNLYPLDVDRAFKSLEKVKDAINIWNPGHARSLQLVQSGEVDFGITYAGRIYQAQEEGLPLAVNTEGGITQASFWLVFKGNPKNDAAWKFVEYTQRIDVQTAFTNRIPGYSPTRKKAWEGLSARAKAKAPDLSLPNTVSMSMSWWAKNFEEIGKRYNDFLTATGKTIKKGGHGG